MADILKGKFTNADHAAHVETVGQRMRDETELDNLKADIRMSKSGEIRMPWKIGRPLRSAGAGPDGMPISPLAAVKLAEVASPTEQAALGREMDRVVIHDAISEGVLDQAEAMGVPLEVVDQWFELDEQSQADEAEVAEWLRKG